MIEKGGMVVREIDGGWGPIGLVLAHKGTVHIPESHVDAGIIRVHADMSTGVRILPKNDDPTTLLWML